MTPEVTKYIFELGGYAAIIEALIILWMVNRWLKAIDDKQKWQEGCKSCLTTLLTQQMKQTENQVTVTQQNTDAIQKLAQDLSVVQKLLTLMETWLKPRTRSRE